MRSYKKKRRNPAEVIEGRFLSPHDRDCIAGLRDLMSDQGLQWDENDQVIATSRWCPIDEHIHGLIADYQEDLVDRESAITGLSESIFRLGEMMGALDSDEVWNYGFWRAMALDLVRYAAETMADM